MTDEKRNLRYLYGLIGKESGPNPIFLIGHPIGSIYITTNSDESTATQMATKYGGTWVAASQGRAIFGAGNNGVNDIAAGDTGGSSYLQSHNHGVTSVTGGGVNTGNVSAGHTHKGYHRQIYNGSGSYSANTASNIGSGTDNAVTQGISANHYHAVPAHSHTVVIASQGSGDSENIPPYEAFYVYKRTA